MDEDARPITLYERWTLRTGATFDGVRSFVETRVVPRYHELSDDVVLGLEVSTDGDSIIAVQRWRNASAHQAATSGHAYERWWEEYEPVLHDWDRLVTLTEEWSTRTVELRNR